MSKSVAIIGGADGPTSIFVSSSGPSTVLIIAICALLGIGLGIGIYFWKERKKDSGI